MLWGGADDLPYQSMNRANGGLTAAVPAAIGGV